MNHSPSSGEQTLRLAPDARGIARACETLLAGGLVAIPTETVYGLAGDATSPEAVARIYAAKGRPTFNPLIAHVPSLEVARREGVFDTEAERLAAAFWPGPLTLVLPVAAGVSTCELARAGLASLALRMPSHPVALRLLEQVGRPLAAPSANRSGRVSPTTADHVLVDLDGRIDAVLDAGPCTVGIESTIVACLDGEVRLLRSGGIARADIEACLGRRLAGAEVETDGQRPLAPGLLSSHYAPAAPMRLNAERPEPGEAFLAFGPLPVAPAGLAGTINLSPSGDTTEAAARLYDALRRLDALTPRRIAVSPIPNVGLGEAINDRLRRAAAPRDQV